MGSSVVTRSCRALGAEKLSITRVVPSLVSISLPNKGLGPSGEVRWSEVTQSCLFVTPWTVAHQAPLSMGFSRQQYWSGLPFPPPGDLSDPGIEPRFPALQADSSLSEPSRKPEPPETNLSFLNSCAFSVYWNIWPCCSDGDFLYNFLQCFHCFKSCI